MSSRNGAQKAAEWSPPKVREEDGVQLQGDSGLPANHRLRAEALVARGARSDPDGIISKELIADTAKRLQAEKAEAAERPAQGE